jgi:hypothetical protein
LRSIAEWLEDTLAEEPRAQTPAEKTKDHIIQWGCGFGAGFAMPALINWLHWHPVWVFLLIVAPAAIAVHYAIGRMAKWWVYALTLTASTILLALLPW